jgi:hypothetical protein
MLSEQNMSQKKFRIHLYPLSIDLPDFNLLKLNSYQTTDIHISLANQ